MASSSSSPPPPPPDMVIARKGRLRQRYDNEYHLVAGCVPYRARKDEGNPCSLAADVRSGAGGGAHDLHAQPHRHGLPQGNCTGIPVLRSNEVTEELESWPEQATHGRRRVSPGEAYQLCRYQWMPQALTALLQRISIIEPVADQSSMYPVLIKNHISGNDMRISTLISDIGVLMGSETNLLTFLLSHFFYGI
ncbi:hypothetical protein GUJ93_ZPchr0002g25672 [Zizania palustris]|uniref:Uncharacterized protein n=1 Tax=Zizania palustris TaxID=103762 RepID=A0A8J5RVB3_ZIZPA|nr:hypothetical protein GUJ93_ZPchr0002g25672 [Zizania palustris]